VGLALAGHGPNGKRAEAVADETAHELGECAPLRGDPRHRAGASRAHGQDPRARSTATARRHEDMGPVARAAFASWTRTREPVCAHGAPIVLRYTRVSLAVGVT
jgi:hypothetical protein